MPQLRMQNLCYRHHWGFCSSKQTLGNHLNWLMF
jgi:hypothetical protein